MKDQVKPFGFSMRFIPFQDSTMYQLFFMSQNINADILLGD